MKNALIAICTLAASFGAHAAGFGGTYRQSEERCLSTGKAPKFDSVYREEGTFSVTAGAITFRKLRSIDSNGNVTEFGNATYTDGGHFDGNQVIFEYSGFGNDGDCAPGDILVLKLVRE
jgi:hypothetical protein